MLIVIHQFELCRGVKAELAIDLRIKYGSMVVGVPLPQRPFIVNRDEIIFHPYYHFRAGSKVIDIHYRKMFPPGLKDEHGNVLPYDLDTLMQITISRWGVTKGYFDLRLDKELESGIEIWRIEKGKETPCSVDRKRPR